MTIILLLFILGLGAAALTGHTTDSRDPSYGLWPTTRAKPRTESRKARR
jgi:hypothetical protein